MANIHGFRDINNNNNNNRPPNRYVYNDDERQQAGNDIPLLFSMPGSTKPAREENLWDMSKIGCCPTFKITQFIVIITLFEIAVFITTLCFGLNDSNDFLPPRSKILFIFGAKYPNTMQTVPELWRFITPTFLHANFMHIVSNSVFQLAYGCRLETAIGIKKMIALYVITGIGGILFSSLISDNLSVGASTSIFGILGAYLGYIWLNWDALKILGPIRYQFLCMILFVVLLNVFIGLGLESNIDNWGHLGGFLTGLFVSVPLSPAFGPRSNTKNFKIIMGAITCAYFLIGFLCFYLNSFEKKKNQR